MTDGLWLLIAVTSSVIAFGLGFMVGTRYAAAKTLKMLDELHTMIKEVK